jgi:tRNA threonylcarbamoyladenosine biosynthesis protein TsaB
MNRIVALDTASEFGSNDLVEDGTVLEEVPLHSPDGIGHVLFPALARLMQRHGWRHSQMRGYAAGSGPGSFTGVRVALAAVKGLAEAAGAKAAAVSNLKAVASDGSAPLRAPFYDARRGEIYGAVYDSQLLEVRPEVVAKFAAWRAGLPAGSELLTAEPEVFGVECPLVPRTLAGAIGRLAGDALVDPVEIDANYVRRSDAELNWVDA